MSYYDKNKEYAKKLSKEWREKNPEYIKEQRIKNKEKFNERQNQKFVCECGGKYTRQNILQHCKTKKHQSWVSAPRAQGE